MKVALLESWTAPISAPSAFAIAQSIEGESQLPDGWGPEPAAVAAPAFPTPFARAEAMRRVLASVDDGPARSSATHPLTSQFEALLLGVVSGALEIEIVDLDRADVFDNFGAALRIAEKSVRYLARLSMRDGSRPSKVFGYSHPRCLFWPHARRTTEDWNVLSTSFTAVKPDAQRLLADWRESLIQAQLWDPKNPVEWQRGVTNVVQGVACSTELNELHEHARMVGPVCLDLQRKKDAGAPRPIYLPTLSRHFARKFISWCRFQPRAAGENVAFVDARGTEVARITLPAEVRAAGMTELGGGVVRELDTRALEPSHRFWFEADKGGEPGLPELLQPLVFALRKAGRTDRQEDIARAPALYPDPIRILGHRNLWRPSDVGFDARCTTRCEDLLLREIPQRLPTTADAHAGGALAVFGQPGVRMIYIESFAGKDIADLRALGAALFLAFVGDAEVDAAALKNRELDLLLDSSAKRPLEPTSAAYDLVLGVDRSRRFRQRLATLQRFVATWSRYEDGSDAEAIAPAALLARSALTFATWANDGEPVRRLGTPGTFDLEIEAAGTKIKLARDGLRAGS